MLIQKKLFSFYTSSIRAIVFRIELNPRLLSCVFGKVVFRIKRQQSSQVRRQFGKLNSFILNEQSILIARLLILCLNYWLIFHRYQAYGSAYSFVFLSAPLFLLVYGLMVWFGPRFFSYRTVNLLLSFPEILFVSFSFYLFPHGFLEGVFLLYLVGITVNVLYGGYLSSILLSLFVNLCYTITQFNHFKSAAFQHFYLLIINFNLVTLLVCIVGSKIKKMIELIQFEKEESKKQLFRLQTLSRIAKEITSELELDKLLNLIVQKTTELTRTNAGGIITFENDKSYRIKAAKGIPKALIGKEIQPNSGLLGRALNERKIASLKITSGIMETPSPLDEQYNFLIFSPIWSKGELLGLIFLLSDSETTPLTKDDKLILETMSEYASIGMVNANLFITTATLCVNDYLTGVGNLRYFYQQLEHCLAVADRYQQPCSLMMVDSDCFREIKHTYGNAQGFMHIKHLADILKATIRSSDLIARYDRDTFMIILPQSSLEDAIILGERIQNQVIGNPNIINEKPITTTVSIGIASYPSQAQNGKMLINAVEAALRQATKLGNNQLVTAAISNNTTVG